MSEREAFVAIGLHPKNETTFFLANMIIEVDEDSLKITQIPGKLSSQPMSTYETSSPFIFTQDDVDYTLSAKNGTLHVHEKQRSISNRQDTPYET